MFSPNKIEGVLSFPTLSCLVSQLRTQYLLHNGRSEHLYIYVDQQLNSIKWNKHMHGDPELISHTLSIQ